MVRRSCSARLFEVRKRRLGWERWDLIHWGSERSELERSDLERLDWERWD
jgi:hypothetical protein